MKPIEEGCLAIVIDAHPIWIHLIGKTVTVGKFVGTMPWFRPELPKDQWEIFLDGDLMYGSERSLLRIDDDGSEGDEEQQQEKDLEYVE